jgi:hypothetical protein
MFLLAVHTVSAQEGSVNPSMSKDSSAKSLNMDAAFNRPFLATQGSSLAIGGYVEANSDYRVEDGLDEGISFQMRRMTLFFSSTINRNLRFLSEIELEDGTKEINIEFAALDFTFRPYLNFRGGIVMNPIGAFNQNHDGPKWEFVDRPAAAVQMLPATWSNVGFGLHGKFFLQGWTLGYEGYLSNGFDETIISNAENKTFLPAAKENTERFEESSNGKPLLTAKWAIRNRKFGEIGLSYMGGQYNQSKADGLDLDKARRVDVVAVDFNSVLPATGTSIGGEFAWVKVGIPDTYSQQFGARQHGGYIDIIHPIFKGTVLDWSDAVLNLGLRLEYVDWNVGTFHETGGKIADDFKAIASAVSFRPTPQSVFRLNYGYHWQSDILGNPAVRTAIWQFGFASYF